MGWKSGTPDTLYFPKKNMSFISFHLTTHSISFHFISFHFTSFHFISSIPSIKIFFMTISTWSFVICSFLFQPSNSCVSFRSWHLFPQLTPVSAARSRFRSYYYSVFKKNVQSVVIFIDYELKCRREDQWNIQDTNKDQLVEYQGQKQGFQRYE